MKILFLVARLHEGGTAQLVVQAAGALRTQGVESLVLAIEPFRAGVGVVDRHIAQLGRWGVTAQSLAPDLVEDKVALAHGLSEKVLSEGIDVIQATQLTNVLPVLLAAQQARVRSDRWLVTTDQDGGSAKQRQAWRDPRRWTRRRARSLRSTMIRRTVAASSMGLTAVSASVAEEYCRQTGLPYGRVGVVYPGFDLRPFEGVVAQRGRGGPELLFVGRLNTDKGADLLPEILARVRSGGHDVSLSIAGDGPLRSEMKRRANALGIEDHLRLLGPTRAIPDLLGRADVFVAPSRHEGLVGFATLEAMAAGVPTVVAGIPAVTEAISDRDAAVAIPGDAGSFARQILSVLEEPDRTRLRTQKARCLVHDQFGLEAFGRRLLARYEELSDHDGTRWLSAASNSLARLETRQIHRANLARR